MGDHRIIVADVLDGLGQLGGGSVQCCVTSPPYWGLRDYSSEGQLGLEPTPDCGRHGFMKLRDDLTEAQRAYVAQRFLGVVVPGVSCSGTDSTK